MPRLPNTSAQLPSALTPSAPKVIAVAIVGRPSAETKIRSTVAAIIGNMPHIRISRKPAARAEVSAGWPVATMIGPPAAQMTMKTSDTKVLSHKAMRTVRRTSRTACLRRPSSAAISGAAAPTRPLPVHNNRPKIDTPSDEAASAASPSLATKMTSIAWTSIWSRFAAASGRASASVARNS